MVIDVCNTILTIT